MLCRHLLAATSAASLLWFTSLAGAQPADPPIPDERAAPAEEESEAASEPDGEPEEALPEPSGPNLLPDAEAAEADGGDSAPASPTTAPEPTPSPSPAPPAGAPADGARGVPFYPSNAPSAHYVPPDMASSDPGPSRDMSRNFWQVYAGVRNTWVPNDAYDPFDDNDGFAQSVIGGSRALVLAPKWSVAPGVQWEFGSVANEARGAESEIFVHRLGAVAEGRYHVGRDLYVLAKLVPHAIHSRAYLSDGSSPDQLQQRTWWFGVDATAGAAWNFPRTFGSRNSIPQFWLVGEFGYGWTMDKGLVLSPDVADDDPRARMELDLGPLNLSGLMMRVNVAMTF